MTPPISSIPAGTDAGCGPGVDPTASRIASAVGSTFVGGWALLPLLYFLSLCMQNKVRVTSALHVTCGDPIIWVIVAFDARSTVSTKGITTRSAGS